MAKKTQAKRSKTPAKGNPRIGYKKNEHTVQASLIRLMASIGATEITTAVTATALSEIAKINGQEEFAYPQRVSVLLSMAWFHQTYPYLYGLRLARIAVTGEGRHKFAYYLVNGRKPRSPTVDWRESRVRAGRQHAVA